MNVFSELFCRCSDLFAALSTTSLSLLACVFNSPRKTAEQIFGDVKEEDGRERNIEGKRGRRRRKGRKFCSQFGKEVEKVFFFLFLLKNGVGVG